MILFSIPSSVPNWPLSLTALLLIFGLISIFTIFFSTHPSSYASLYFVIGVDPEDNELNALEIIHHFVEVLDRYFGNVCELDLIFNFHKAYYLLDELIIAGELQESSKKAVLRVCAAQDALMDENKDAGDKDGALRLPIRVASLLLCFVFVRLKTCLFILTGSFKFSCSARSCAPD